MEGWVKLHRGIDGRGWRHDLPTLSLFLYCLTHANIEERERRGNKVGIGELVIGLHKLAGELKMSVQTLRTAISHLKSTNEITIKSTSKFSVITVVGWEKYQYRETKTTNKITNTSTNDQQTTNKQLTTLKEYKKERTEEAKGSPLEPGGLEGFTRMANQMKVELLEIWPACTDSQFAKTVAKCYEWATRGGKEIDRPGQLLRSWFAKQLDFMSGYEAGLTGPSTPEQWVKEYNEIKGVKFEEKYGAEKAREVRDRRFNKDMYGIYIVTENKDGE